MLIFSSTAIATELIIVIDAESFKQLPTILKNRAAVESLPNIAKWIKERPVTEH